MQLLSHLCWGWLEVEALFSPEHPSQFLRRKDLSSAGRVLVASSGPCSEAWEATSSLRRKDIWAAWVFLFRCFHTVSSYYHYKMVEYQPSFHTALHLPSKHHLIWKHLSSLASLVVSKQDFHKSSKLWNLFCQLLFRFTLQDQNRQVECGPLSLEECFQA